MSELGKAFLEITDQKINKTENQCQNAASEQKSEKWKFDSNKKKLGLK